MVESVDRLRMGETGLGGWARLVLTGRLKVAKGVLGGWA